MWIVLLVFLSGETELGLWVAADELVAGEVCYSRGMYSIGESSVGY